MPFNIAHVDLGGSERLRAATYIAERLRGWAAERAAEAHQRNAELAEEQRTRERNQGIFQGIVNYQEANGGNYLPKKVIDKWDTLSPAEQSGHLAAASDFIHLNSRKQPDSAPFVPYGMTIQNPQTGESVPVWIDSPNHASRFAAADDNQDSWTKLTKDVKSQSGYGTADWQRAINKRIEGDDFVAELPGTNSYVMPNGKVVGDTKTIRMPRQVYSSFHSRFKTLENSLGDSSSGNRPGEELSDTELADMTGQSPLPGATTTANPPASAQPSPVPAAAATAPVINSEADYAAVQPGAFYIHGPSGQLKRKKAARQ